MKTSITKSRAGHYTVTIHENGWPVFSKGLIDNIQTARAIAAEFIAAQESGTDEETKTPDARVIQLAPEQAEELTRAMQWPEDLERFDHIAKPTNLTEIKI
jgi:hypothetical protein